MDITNILGSETPLEGPTALNENAGGGRKGKKSWVKTTKTNNLQNPMKSSQTEKLEETEYGKSSFIAGGPAVGLKESETTRPSPSLSHSNYYLVS